MKQVNKGKVKPDEILRKAPKPTEVEEGNDSKTQLIINEVVGQMAPLISKIVIAAINGLPSPVFLDSRERALDRQKCVACNRHT